MSEGTELATNVSAVFDEQFTEEKVEQEVIDVEVDVDVDVEVDVDVDVDVDVKVSDALVEEGINQLTSEISEDELKTLGQSGTLDFS